MPTNKIEIMQQRLVMDIKQNQEQINAVDKKIEML